jgi:hypothetical protein
MSEVQIFHDPDAKPQEWRVEEIDSDGDGGIDMASSQARTPNSGPSVSPIG